MKPSYQIVPVIQTPEIDPGGPVKISIFISGFGDVDKNKLYVNHYHEEIIDEENPGTLRYCIHDAHDKESGEYSQPASGEDYLCTHQLDAVSVYLNLAKSYFVGDSRNLHSERALPHSVAEQTHDQLAPLEYELNTKDDARPGNYDITFSLSYTYEDMAMQDTQTVVVHVNNWKEAHQTKLEIVGTILALGILLVSAGIF
ncbi:hypothetical protein E6P09_17240 (plasmid) [Haloferax mediterranei ATCC 33500]|nr:hypothetical protein [Haloferax mediterranei]MDX5990280.1 hypothetical protein [Haloferax mediterranei ATCC 33500]QCQ77049.1 hypothetical protein E6P09_17240 [Haloferax mediterranei ATCC 33500]